MTKEEMTWTKKWAEDGFNVFWKDSVRAYVGVAKVLPVDIQEKDIVTGKTVSEMDEAILVYNQQRGRG